MIPSQSQLPIRSSHLDLLRGLAISGVVGIHSVIFSDVLVQREGGKIFETISYLLSLGKYGVELFFVISGFLLYSLYSDRENFDLAKYAKRRVGRIYPLWILFLLIILTKSYFLAERDSSGLIFSNAGEGFFSHKLFVVVLLTATFMLWISESLWNGVIPGGWSIQAEVGHYFFFPILRKWSTRKILGISLAVNLISALLYFLKPELQTLPEMIVLAIEAWIRLNVFATLGYFLLGYLGAQIFQTLSHIKYNSQQEFQHEFPSLLASFWFLSFLLIPLNFGRQIEAIGWVTLCILSSIGIKESRKLRKGLIILGKYSYFIYFVHFLVIELLGFIVSNLNIKLDFPFSQLVIFLFVYFATLATSQVLAIPSYKYFESFFIRWSHK